jgi:glycine/D-amino acid oxidase-like deaminating enzyme
MMLSAAHESVFKYCVVGNGLIGAAVSLQLARLGEQVVTLGARFGDEGQYYSSHEDDARIFRCSDSDPYWQTLAGRNLPQLERVVRETGLPIYRKVPVFYRIPPSSSGALRQFKRREASADVAFPDFVYEDMCGGIINPKLYIQGMNAVAASLGVTMKRCIVRRIDRCAGHFQIYTSDGEFSASRIIDARGAWSAEALEDMPPVVGKIGLYVESPAQEPEEPFCVIDASPDEDTFINAYACCYYREVEGRLRSRLGFTESKPIVLTSVAAIAKWFDSEYRSYPFLNEADRWLRRLFHHPPNVVRIKPCVFSITSDGRPLVRSSNDRIVVTGCNGLAAKACQALAEDIIDQWL